MQEKQIHYPKLIDMLWQAYSTQFANPTEAQMNDFKLGAFAVMAYYGVAATQNEQSIQAAAYLAICKEFFEFRDSLHGEHAKACSTLYKECTVQEPQGNASQYLH